MDGIALWILFLVFLPFLLFFWKMLLMAWKSFLYTKKIKNLSDEIEMIVYPNDSYTISQGYAAYGCFIAILLLVLFAVVIKIALKRKQLQHRNAALRRNIARQNQLATVSRSIDANSIYSNDGESNRRRRDSDATLKIDLPPTYEDAMKNFTESREVVATSPTISPEEPVETRDTHGTVAIEIVTIPNSQQRSIVV